MNAAPDIAPVRSPDDIAAATGLGWKFFDFVRAASGANPEVDKHLADHRFDEKFADFAQHFLPPKGDCLLARLVDGTPVGVVMLTAKSPERCEMNRMFVAEEARGTGLGRALCSGVIDRAREMGFRLMTLDTIAPLAAAIALYRAMGFEDDDSPGLYGAEDPMIVNMRLRLDRPPLAAK